MFKSIKNKREEEREWRERERERGEQFRKAQRQEAEEREKRRQERVRQRLNQRREDSKTLRSYEVNIHSINDNNSVVSVNNESKLLTSSYHPKRTELWGSVNYNALENLKSQQDMIIDQVVNLENQNHILLERTQQLTEQLIELKNLLLYMPPSEEGGEGGIEFEHAKKDFENTVKNF